jgi:hypothetical protein
MNRKNYFAGAALLSGLLIASQASAFRILTCNGNPIVWGSPFEMMQNTFSIPGGSTQQTAMKNAVDRWNGVIGMQNMVSMSVFGTTGNVITTGDGENDVAVTAPVNIGGRNGLTLMIRSLCFFSSSWGEADVFVSNTLPFGHIAEDSLTTSGRSTFLHEFGHAHGLQHQQRANFMRAKQPRPVVGGPNETVDPLPDDAAGGRFLYPSGFLEFNLFASAFRRTSGDQIVLNQTGTKTFCSKGGGTLTLNTTIGNNGSVLLIQTERWWVSTSNNDHTNSSGFQIFQKDNTVFEQEKTTQSQVTITMPALPAGTYFLYHGVDVFKGLESREDDNAVREALKIQVNNC